MGRNSCVPASYLFLQKGDQILLLKRANTGYQDGKYSLVAGHVESGESFSKCVIREALEEVGIVVEESDLAVVHTMYRKADSPHASERIDVFFRSTQWKGDIRNMEPEKCSEVSWIDMRRIPSNTIPYIQKVIEYILSGVSFSEYGWYGEI